MSMAEFASMTAYVCPLCGALSHHPADAEMRYCCWCRQCASDPPSPVHDLIESLEVIDGGWRVKATDDGRLHLDVMGEMWGWLLVTTPIGEGPAHRLGWVQVRGWCYRGYGLGPDRIGRTMSSAFRAAVTAAQAWEGADDTAPAGYDKTAAA